MNIGAKLLIALAALASGGLCADWNPQLAAEYLDARQKEWFEWKPAAAPGGPCVSCHTGVTYLWARPVLRKALGESRPTEYETGLLNALRARVDKKQASEVFPGIRKEPAASQALGVESIHAALLLALENKGSGKLSAVAERAFDRMWSFQLREGKSKGAWEWFSLNLDPWEMPESAFYGAALAALAVGSAPAEYRSRAGVRPLVTELTAYLEREQQTQPLHNRLMLLWVSRKLSEAAPASLRRSIIDQAWRKQEADGGWSIESLGAWKEHPAAVPSTCSSSYATAFAAFTLQRAGVPGSDLKIRRALDWLRSRQDPKSGHWPAQSMNKQYPPGSMQSRFMQDAATALAAVALIEGGGARSE